MPNVIRDAKAIFRRAVQSVQADRLAYPQQIDACRAHVRSRGGAIQVLAAGKAALAMAVWLERKLGDAIAGGLAVVPHGYADTCPEHIGLPDRIAVTEAGHPVPDAQGLEAASRALNIADKCGAVDALVILLSGGASALWPAPAPGLTLDHLARANRTLLKSGADIHQINTLRKHLSGIKGGRLAAAASPACVLTLAVSDVIGDDLSVIGSGPATADSTTFADCLELAEVLGADLPQAVMRHLALGAKGLVPEPPKPGDKRLQEVQSMVLASNRTALRAAGAEAAHRGYRVVNIAHDVAGEARHIGTNVTRRALSLGPRQCLLWGGESTVVVRGRGKGGRNQELVLAAACELASSKMEVIVLSGGTDGIDGPTDAAGAWATPATLRKGRRLGLDAASALHRNDAYTYFDGVDQLIRTGPTHTNVMDVGLVLTGSN